MQQQNTHEQGNGLVVLLKFVWFSMITLIGIGFVLGLIVSDLLV